VQTTPERYRAAFRGKGRQGAGGCVATSALRGSARALQRGDARFDRRVAGNSASHDLPPEMPIACMFCGRPSASRPPRRRSAATIGSACPSASPRRRRRDIRDGARTRRR
jgi:hypothetical protein